MEKGLTYERAEVQEIAYKSGSMRYMDSREVAEIIEKKHCNLVRDIKKYSTELTKLNFEFSDFFIESSYSVEGQSRKYPCYLVTRKGCEFIAHKLTGERGTKFTATYINRFHEMEDALDGQVIPVLQQLIERQEEFNQAVMKKLESLEERGGRKTQGNPFLLQGSVIEERMRTLNGLVDQVSELCGIERNKVLHFMYKALQERLGISLNPYLSVMKSERGVDICNMDVIASVDRFYEKAVEMNQFVIERKRLYG